MLMSVCILKKMNTFHELWLVIDLLVCKLQFAKTLNFILNCALFLVAIKKLSVGVKVN